MMSIKQIYINLAEDESYKPCPMCGKRDRVFIETRNFYEDLLREHGKACLEIECDRCRVKLTTYAHDFANEIGYDKRVEDIRDKWNTRTVSV